VRALWVPRGVRIAERCAVSAPAAEPLLCAKCGRRTLVKVKKDYRRPCAWSCSNVACAEHQRSRKFIGKVEVV
jgi:hypothetical protein